MPSMQLKALLALLPFLALAQSESDSCEPCVDLANGSYVGVSNEHYAQEFFLGIPYAQPPTGSLRFASPKPLTEAFEEPRDAKAYGNSCIGYGADTLGLDTPLSEDCLNLNVVRPEGTEPGDDLPVGIWVHGGSYVTGGSSDSRYNLSKIVDQSVQEGKPIIGVSINYRLSYWGFLFSEEMDAAGAGNVAFKDQRLAFQWIHDNIAAFGGSPDKVTIWGESAGARSLGMQLIGYEGKYDKLFRSAILESGSPVAQFVGAEEWQPYFDYVVEKTNCSSADDHLDCLREVPSEALNAIFNGTTPSDVKVPSFSAVIDGDFITAQATELLAAGKFAHVPLLLGNNHDEGTAYGKQGINTTEEFQEYVASFSLNSSQVDELTSLYPDDPAVGIPPSYPGRPEAYPFGLQWKRVAAFAGDFQQHAGRRLLAETYAGAGLDVYSYIWNVYVNGIPAIRGATHFQEVAFVFNDVSSSEFDGKPETFVHLADLMSKMWVHFMHDTEPNYDDAYNATTWPKYTLDEPDNIVFDVNRTGLTYIEKDDYRKTEIAYLQTEVY